MWFNDVTKKFVRKPPNADAERSFAHFVLKPFYKLIGYTISEEKDRPQSLLNKMKIYSHKKEFDMNLKPLLKQSFLINLVNLSA